MKIEQYGPLATKRLAANTTYIHPERLPEVVHYDSPALHVMTDFKSRPPVTTTSEVLVKQALDKMALSGIKSLFVIDDEDHIIGNISAMDCQGIKLGQVASQYDIKISEVTVGMLMTPHQQLHTLNIKYLDSACVGHIARLFHDLGVNYLLVVEDTGHDRQMVRGLFSISRMRRQLGEAIASDYSSSHVAEIIKQMPE